MKETTTFQDFEKGKKAAKTKKVRGKVISHRIEKADNGFISHTEHAPAAGAEKELYDYSKLHSTKVHKTAAEAGSHASQMMGGPELFPQNEPEEATAQEAQEGETGNVES